MKYSSFTMKCGKFLISKFVHTDTLSHEDAKFYIRPSDQVASLWELGKCQSGLHNSVPLRDLKNFRSLDAGSYTTFIWLEGHFRLIYFEEMMKIEPILIHSSQILVYFDGRKMVNMGYSCFYWEDMHFVDSPPHHCTINSNQSSV